MISFKKSSLIFIPALFIAASLAAMDPPQRELPQDFEIQEYYGNKLKLARLCLAMFDLADDFNVALAEPTTKLDSLEHPLDRHAFIVLHKAYDGHKAHEGEEDLINLLQLFDFQASKDSKDFMSNDLKHKFEQNNAPRLIDLLSFLLVRRSRKANDEFQQLLRFEWHLKSNLSKNSVESTNRVSGKNKKMLAYKCLAMLDWAPAFAAEIPKPKEKFYHMECPIDQYVCNLLKESHHAARISQSKGNNPPYPREAEYRMSSYLTGMIEDRNDRHLSLFGLLGFLLVHKSTLSPHLKDQLEEFKKDLQFYIN